MSPAGFFAVVAMPVVGRLLGRGTDARWLIAAGLLIDGRRQLLDVADEPGHQPGPGRLAAGRVDRGAFDMLRARRTWRPTSIRHWRCAERLSACSACCATRAAASARRWRRRCTSAASNSTPCGSANISIRSIRPCIPSSSRRRGCLQQTGDPVALAAAGLAGAGESAPAASIRPRLFRCLLAVGGRDARARACGAVDETLGCRERRSDRRRMSRLGGHHCTTPIRLLRTRLQQLLSDAGQIRATN